MNQSQTRDIGDKGNLDLQSLLSQEPIRDWGPIHRRIDSHPHEVHKCSFRNESVLQHALKVQEMRQEDFLPASIHNLLETMDSFGQIDSNKKISRTNRIDVLKSITSVNPGSIHWRCKEGRTSLHTACSAGRSFEILQWLIDEESRLLRDCLEGTMITWNENATLRTDFPGGALALHSVAACSTFDDLYFRTNGQMAENETTADSTYSKCLEEFQSCPVSVKLTPNILAAYASTSTIIKANPEAVWDKDCEGETPLHAAASWGNIGSVLALLTGAAESSSDYKDKITCSGSTAAALITNDRNKNPLDCACERINAFSVQAKELSLRRNTINIQGSARGISDGRGSFLRTSMSTRSQRRSQLTTSFVLSGGLFGGDDNSNDDTLRTSCTFPRRPTHPIFGFECLDEDGDEELTKCELLAMAACGNFSSTTEKVNHFHFVHAATKLCSPEVVWHAARKYPAEVTMKDEFGRVPLFLACERLVTAVRSKTALGTQEAADVSSQLASHLDSSVDFLDLADGGRTFVESFFLGEPNSLLNFPIDSLSAFAAEEVTTSQQIAPFTGRDNPRNQQPSKETPNMSFLSAEDQVKFAVEIADMLLYSSAFGNKEMAAVPNNEGRLPLHVVLEAVPWTGHNHKEAIRADFNNSWSINKAAVGHPHIIKSLIDAYPLALETMDGTGFYPFMIAAIAPQRDKLTSDNDAKEEMYLSSVETVFRLLVESPAVMSLCV